MKREEKLRRIKDKVSDEKVDERKSEEEQEIAKEGEIMELVNPEDEMEEDLAGDESERE